MMVWGGIALSGRTELVVICEGSILLEGTQTKF
jgi:hypothetical protein